MLKDKSKWFLSRLKNPQCHSYLYILWIIIASIICVQIIIAWLHFLSTQCTDLHEVNQCPIQNVTCKCTAPPEIPLLLCPSSINYQSKYDLQHLNNPDDPYVAGPVQDDEALVLFSLVKGIRPKVIVEFGFYEGDSANNFLMAMDRDAELHSYDIHGSSDNIQHLKRMFDNSFIFHLKSQTSFSPPKSYQPASGFNRFSDSGSDGLDDDEIPF